MNFGNYAESDLIGEEHFELSFAGYQSTTFNVYKHEDRYRQYRSETIVNVAGSTW